MGPVRRTLLRALVWLPVLVVVLTIAVCVVAAVLGDWLRPAEYR